MSDLEELKSELNTPIKSFRLFALEKVMKLPASIELLEIVEDCLKKEKDSECLILLKHAVQNLKTSIDGVTPESVLIGEISQLFSGATPERQMELLKLVKVSSLKGCNPEKIVPELLNKAAGEVVIAEIIRKFRRFWPDNLRQYLEKLVFCKSRCLQIAAIETLIRIYPESLKSNLHKLFNINDPVIRSLAIWSMGRFFPELAADFIDDCFEKGDYYNKATALKICSTLDFSLIKNSLLKLIFSEVNPKILNAACLIILNNPDKEMPFRIMDIATRCEKEKARFLNEFLPGYCENLKISGIFKDFSAFERQLSEYAKTLKARVFVHGALQQLVAVNHENQPLALAEFKMAIKSNPDIAKAAQDLQIFASNIEFKDLLARALDETIKVEPDLPADKKTAKAEASKSSEIYDQSESSLIKEFARARFSCGQKTLEKAREILNQPEASKALRLAAFKAATCQEVPGLLPVAAEFIASDNEFEVSAALEYLEKFDKDEFHRATQKLIHTKSIFIRNALINFTSRNNPDYARFLIRTLLKSREPGKRLNGIESTVQLDFSYIFPDLTSFLEIEERPELIQAGLSIVLANPCLDGFFQLQRLKDKRPAFKTIFEKAAAELLQMLEKTGIASQEEVEAYVAKKKKEAQARSNSHQQAKDLVKARSTLSWKTKPTKLPWISEHGLQISVAIILLVVISFAGFFLQRRQNPAEKKKITEVQPIKTSKTRAKALQKLPAANSQKTLKLISFDPANKTWLVEDEGNKSFRIFLANPQAYKSGQTLKAVVEASRYSLTGKVVIFVKAAEVIK